MLPQLYRTQSPANADFVQLFKKWPGLLSSDVSEFYHHRTSLVKSVAGVHFEHGRTITTSGHSTGASKSYRWGPAFQATYDFILLTLEDSTPRARKAAISVLPSYPRVYSGETNGQHIFTVATSDLVNTLTQTFQHFPNGRTAWSILPTYTQALIAHAPQVFDQLDPVRHFFLSCGEPSSRSLRQFFKDRGLLYLDSMRSWMGGVTFLTCPHGNQHFLDFMSEIKTEPVGNFQELITTDLWNLAQPFINFPTGDIVDWTRRETCACGYPIDDFEFQPRDPALIIKGLPLRFVDLAGILDQQCQKLLGLQKICCSFCLADNVMTVDLLVNGTLQGVDVSPLEREFGEYLGLRCVVQEGVTASIYKVAAITQR